MEKLECKLAGQCSGCPWIDRPYTDQVALKRQTLLRLFSESGLPSLDIHWREIAPGRLRDRVDLTFDRRSGTPVFGIFDLQRKAILNMDACPMMSVDLEKWLIEFQKNPPPIEFGSIRLRVSPNGERGVWLDFSNVDVKSILEEETWLNWLMQKCFVEIGQRKKHLVRTDRLRLSDPEPRKWFQTYNVSETPIGLYGVVGGFTQVGFLANRTLVAEVLSLAKTIRANSWLEMFAGSGNFTFALASLGKPVTAYELDDLAVQCLNLTKKENPSLPVTVNRGDAYQSKHWPDFTKFDAVLVDPPRSGLKALVDKLIEPSAANRVRNIIYVSCFAESLAQDLSRLVSGGYRISRVSAVDQFPQSPHCEWVVHLTLRE